MFSPKKSEAMKGARKKIECSWSLITRCLVLQGVSTIIIFSHAEIVALEAVVHVMGYLKLKHKLQSVFDPTYPGIDCSNFKECDLVNFCGCSEC